MQGIQPSGLHMPSLPKACTCARCCLEHDSKALAWFGALPVADSG